MGKSPPLGPALGGFHFIALSTADSPSSMSGGGGGHCLFEGRYPGADTRFQKREGGVRVTVKSWIRRWVPKTKLHTPASVLSHPSLTALAGLQPPVFKVPKDNLLLLLLLLRLTLNRQDFSVILLHLQL